MKTTTGIKSTIKPNLIEYTDDAVYMRSNITEETEKDPVFNTDNTVYIYDEVEYNAIEWSNIIFDTVKGQINNINSKIIKIISTLVEQGIINPDDIKE